MSLSCKAFWGTGTNTAVTPCTNAAIAGALYGFVATNGVTVAAIAAATGTEALFTTTATHASLAGVTFTVNAAGTITNDGGF